VRRNQLKVKLSNHLLKDKKEKVKKGNQSSKKKRSNLIQMMTGKKLISRKNSLNGKTKTQNKDSQKIS
jgi:hypothetical protein